MVPCHPAWLKEAEKAGIDLGIGERKSAPEKTVDKEKAEKAGKAEKVEKTVKTPKLKV